MTYCENPNDIVIKRGTAYDATLSVSDTDGNPYELREVDEMFYNDPHPILTREEILEIMIPYMEKNHRQIPRIIPHMIGLYRGQPYASVYKKALLSRDVEKLKEFLIQSHK